MEGIIGSVLIGIAAGWLSGQIMKGRGFGLLGDLIVGVVGAVIGNTLFHAIGLTPTGLIGSLVTATAGAVVLLFGLRVLSGRK